MSDLDPAYETPERYRGFNPEFVHRVWAKRRAAKPPANVRWFPEDKARIGELMLAGKSLRQIGIAMGCSRSAIAGVIRLTPELLAIRRAQKGVSIQGGKG